MEVRLEIPEAVIEALAEKIKQEVVKELRPLLIKGHQEEDTVFDVKGLCEYLKVSDKWVYERTHLNEIPYFKVKGLLRFRKKDIDQWLESYKVPAASGPKRTLRAVK